MSVMEQHTSAVAYLCWSTSLLEHTSWGACWSTAAVAYPCWSTPVLERTLAGAHLLLKHTFCW